MAMVPWRTGLSVAAVGRIRVVAGRVIPPEIAGNEKTLSRPTVADFLSSRIEVGLHKARCRQGYTAGNCRERQNLIPAYGGGFSIIANRDRLSQRRWCTPQLNPSLVTTVLCSRIIGFF